MGMAFSSNNCTTSSQVYSATNRQLIAAVASHCCGNEASWCMGDLAPKSACQTGTGGGFLPTNPMPDVVVSSDTTLAAASCATNVPLILQATQATHTSFTTSSNGCALAASDATLATTIAGIGLACCENAASFCESIVDSTTICKTPSEFKASATTPAIGDVPASTCGVAVPTFMRAKNLNPSNADCSSVPLADQQGIAGLAAACCTANGTSTTIGASYCSNSQAAAYICQDASKFKATATPQAPKINNTCMELATGFLALNAGVVDTANATGFAALPALIKSNISALGLGCCGNAASYEKTIVDASKICKTPAGYNLAATLATKLDLPPAGEIPAGTVCDTLVPAAVRELHIDTSNRDCTSNSVATNAAITLAASTCCGTDTASFCNPTGPAPNTICKDPTKYNPDGDIPAVEGVSPAAKCSVGVPVLIAASSLNTSNPDCSGLADNTKTGISGIASLCCGGKEPFCNDLDKIILPPHCPAGAKPDISWLCLDASKWTGSDAATTGLVGLLKGAIGSSDQKDSCINAQTIAGSGVDVCGEIEKNNLMALMTLQVDKHCSDGLNLCESPPEPTGDEVIVIKHSVTFAGVTAAQLDTADKKTALEGAIAENLGVCGKCVKITSIESSTTRRRRRLLTTGATINYQVTLPASEASKRATVTKATTDKTFLDAFSVQVAQTAGVQSATVSGFGTPSVAVEDPSAGGNGGQGTVNDDSSATSMHLAAPVALVTAAAMAGVVARV